MMVLLKPWLITIYSGWMSRPGALSEAPTLCAEEVGRFEKEGTPGWFTSALSRGGALLVVQDAATHPEYTNTLGGEYTIAAVEAMLVPDWDRDRQITEDDACASWKGKPFRFWINDDDDGEAICDGDDDIPGEARWDDRKNGAVDGIRDLVDFFPVWLDVHDVLAMLPADAECRLVQEDEAVNVAYTDLAVEHAGEFLVATNPLYGPGFNQFPHEAPVFEVEKENTVLATAFMDKIRSGAAPPKGVLMLEGRDETALPLVFEAWKDGKRLFATEMPLSISRVEEMYR